MAEALATPQAAVNGVAIWIVPNSASMVLGKGESKTRVASGGGNRVETYNTKDVTTFIGRVKFKMVTTNESVNQVEEWKDRFDTNEVTIVEKGVTKTLKKAIIQNDPEIMIGVEGEVEIEFSGKPVI